MVEDSYSSHKMQEEPSCQEGGCDLVEGENSTCCWVPANQTLLNVTGLDPYDGYSVTVSASNGAGEGEKSMPVITTRELLQCHIYLLSCVSEKLWDFTILYIAPANLCEFCLCGCIPSNM